MDGRTALHYVACWGDLEVAKSILAHPKIGRRHIHMEDIFGHSPLALATVRSRQGGGGDERDLGLQGRG